MINGNKGEWSELFVLANLLTEGKLNIADENLVTQKDSFFEVNKVITSAESLDKIIYEIENDEVLIFDPELNTEEKIKRNVIKNKILVFLNEITLGVKGSRSFSLVEGNKIAKLLKVKKLSATSNHKADLTIESYDTKTRRITSAGYSIKSQLGAAPTLFNASQATNLEYQIVGINDAIMDEINTEASCRDRVKKIYEIGKCLTYLKTCNNTFNQNLMMVDSNFSNILAEAVVVFYKSDYRTLKDIISELRNTNINNFPSSNIEYFLLNNFKKFVFYSALGMVANTLWDGLSTATGGIIIVKKNSEIIGYTPYNINLFQEYLINKTKFDSPDSGRNKYGKVYKINNDYFIKLNFQIRFID